MSNKSVRICELKTYKLGQFLRPGEFYFVQTQKCERAGIVHACPCGCGRNTLLFFRGCSVDNSPEWDVKGEWPDVTLNPSVGVGKQPGGGFHWHGYLENGYFVER